MALCAVHAIYCLSITPRWLVNSSGPERDVITTSSRNAKALRVGSQCKLAAVTSYNPSSTYRPSLLALCPSRLDLLILELHSQVSSFLVCRAHTVGDRYTVLSCGLTGENGRRWSVRFVWAVLRHLSPSLCPVATHPHSLTLPVAVAVALPHSPSPSPPLPEPHPRSSTSNARRKELLLLAASNCRGVGPLPRPKHE